MNEVKVSIIIPVYNPGELLKKSLDSAANQSLKEIEIICVDDGSKDGSADILNEYARKDSRFIILRQENSGAGQARNNGLNHAKGEYIVFLDADDWIDESMCELLYNHAKNLDVDLILFDNRWYLQNDDGDLTKENTQDFIHFEDFPEDYSSFIFNYKYVHNKVLSGFFGVIWTKFYKSSFLKDNGIEFPRHKMFNDIEFHIKSLLLAEKIAYCPKIFYHYNKTGHPSIQTSYMDKKESIVFYEVMVGVRDFLIEYGFMDEFRLDFLNYSFRHFYAKINSMEENYKEEYFLKIKSFFESILITSDEFEQMSFRNLPIYVHIVNSKTYGEFVLRHNNFDMESLNPNKYPHLEDSYKILKNENLYNAEEFGEDYLDYENRSQSNIRKHKEDCNNLYIMRLESMLNYEEDVIRQKNNEIDSLSKEIADLEYYLNNLKKTADEYYKIKENYRLIQEQNKELVEENNELKNNFINKMRTFF